jgi:23S rRNA pseudouridine1911/1915/1917 synthase
MTAPPTKKAVVDEHEAGATLAAVVRGMMDQLPWSKAKKLVSTGRVELDGHPVFDPATRVEAGQLIVIAPTSRKRQVEELEAKRILYVDHDIVVVDKPAGLVSVPFTEDERDHLLARTSARLGIMEAQMRAGQKGKSRAGAKGARRGPPPLYVVQRLDKDTTGVLVFARTRKAKKALENQLRKHSITRVYKALTVGRADSGSHDSWLVADAGAGRRGSWRGQGRPPKAASHAITHVKRERILNGATLVSCELETGRQHQIRIHLAESGHPLIGERIYSRGLPSPPPELRAERPMLHAELLGFKHPADERFVHFRSPLPRDFQQTLERLDQDPG